MLTAVNRYPTPSLHEPDVDLALKRGLLSDLTSRVHCVKQSASGMLIEVLVGSDLSLLWSLPKARMVSYEITWADSGGFAQATQQC